MPLPQPQPGESQDDFIGRCMSNDTVQQEADNQEQALAICHSLWEENTMSDSNIKTGQVERRVVPYSQAAVELRAADEGAEARGIGGLGIPVGAVADIGPFTEEIAPEAVRQVIDEGWDVRGLFNHDPNYVLGKTGAGTMTLRATEQGLAYEVAELPAARADVLEAVQRGDVDGNSFSFSVPEDGEEWDESGDKPHRTIRRFARVYDLGPVTFPAYSDDTVVSARALSHVVAGAEPEPVLDEEAAARALERRRRIVDTVEAEIAADEL